MVQTLADWGWHSSYIGELCFCSFQSLSGLQWNNKSAGFDLLGTGNKTVSNNYCVVDQTCLKRIEEEVFSGRRWWHILCVVFRRCDKDAFWSFWPAERWNERGKLIRQKNQWYHIWTNCKRFFRPSINMSLAHAVKIFHASNEDFANVYSFSTPAASLYV